MFILILFDIVFVLLTRILFKSDKTYRYILYLLIAGFTIYSGIGIFMYDISHKYLYLFQFVMFSLMFLTTAIRSQKKTSYALPGMQTLLDKYNVLIIVLTVVYILTFIYPLFLGNIKLADFLGIRLIFSNYTSTPFSIRVARRNNAFYTIVVNQIRSITAPFFYLLLYKYRKKPILFIALFLFPVYCNTIADSYISRNNIAVNLAFIIIYLVSENYMRKRTAVLIFAIGSPILLAAFSSLFNVRQGGTFNLSFDGFRPAILSIINSECNYPIYYDICVQLSEKVSLLNFILYIVFAWIPSSVFVLLGGTVPNLAYTFTEGVIGLTYGARDYYIVLPSVLGESLMLYGDVFAFLHGLFYGIFVFWFYRVLDSHYSLKYLKIFFILDFFRQFRGGSQYVLSSWMTTLVPFIVICYFLTLPDRKNLKIKIG